MIKNYTSLVLVIGAYALQSFAADLDVKKSRAVASGSTSSSCAPVSERAKGGSRKLYTRGGLLGGADLCDLSSVAFSPTHIVGVGSHKDLRFWRHEGVRECCLNEKNAVKEHGERIRLAAFNRHGNLLAVTGDGDVGNISLWSFQNEQASFLTILPGHRLRVDAVAFGKYTPVLASASGDMTVRLWDLENLKRVVCAAVFAGHGGSPINSIAFKNGDRMLVSAGRDGAIRGWSISTLLTPGFKPSWEVQTVDQQVPITPPVEIALHPYGTYLASANCESLQIWNIENPRDIQFCGELDSGKEASQRLVAFNHDGTILASASGRSVILWDVQVKVPLQVLEMPASKIQLSPESMQLAVVTPSGQCALFEKNSEMSLDARREHVFRTLVKKYLKASSTAETPEQDLAFKRTEKHLRLMTRFWLRSSPYPYETLLAELLKHNATYALYEAELSNDNLEAMQRAENALRRR